MMLYCEPVLIFTLTQVFGELSATLVLKQLTHNDQINQERRWMQEHMISSMDKQSVFCDLL